MLKINGPETIKVIIKKGYIWPDSSIGAVLIETPTTSLALTFPQIKVLCIYLKDINEHFHGE
jgi:hypothetical protein